MALQFLRRWIVCCVLVAGVFLAAAEKEASTPGDGSLKGRAGIVYKGQIPVSQFLRFISGYRGCPVVFDSSNPAFDKKIKIVNDMSVTEEVVRAILAANGFHFTESVRPDGTEIIEVEFKTTRPKAASPIIILDENRKPQVMGVYPGQSVKRIGWAEAKHLKRPPEQGMKSVNAVAQTIPFERPLDDAAIAMPSLDRITEDALIIGNGDINGLVTARGKSISIMLTKNDVWDARLDSKLDPPLPTLARIKELAAGKWPNKTQVLPEGSTWKGPDSYHTHAYPCPRACARLVIGGSPNGMLWGCIRAQGRRNEWTYEKNAAVMRIEGNKEASNGWRVGPLSCTTGEYNTLQVRVCGSENARFFVDVMDDTNQVVLGSGWQETPLASKAFDFTLPADRSIGYLILYTWTEDGKLAENRFESVMLKGTAGEKVIDLESARTVSSAGRLDIRKAVAHIDGAEDGPPKATIRALAQRNVFLIESESDVSIEALRSTDLPAVTKSGSGEITWLKQVIPGDDDWPGMSFAVALAHKGRFKAVAIVTDREARDVVKAAAALADGTVKSPLVNWTGEHETIWRNFWSKSGIFVDDPLLCKTWYRGLYFLRCVSKPGVVAPGLFASLINDKPAWHGDYHTNYNIQQTFWGCYAANHPELAAPYDTLIREYLPRGEWMARKIFDMQGAYYPHVIFAYEPPDPEKCKSPVGRQYIHHVWGFTIGVAGFTAQPLWWQYKYAPDRAYLEQVAYPVIRGVALFYADFIDQCEKRDGRVVLAPSVSPEHWGWTANFERNRDGTFDIGMARYTLQAAIEGAGILGRDADLVARFKKVLALLPEYPTTKSDTPVVVDVAGAPPINYNIAVPATPVFPCDVVTWQSPAEERALFMRTIEGLHWNGNNSTVILGVARARLNMPGTIDWIRKEIEARLRPNGTMTLNRRVPHHGFNDFGHYTEQFGATMAVSELLLQSVGDVIRVFPAWPRSVSARFARLRAQGGFLVSASNRDSTIEIVSTVGGKLRLHCPWHRAEVHRQARDGKKEKLTVDRDARDIISIDTKTGDTITITY